MGYGSLLYYGKKANEDIRRLSDRMVHRTKVLLSKLGLDVHNRGLITVAKELRDAGMEVIYIGNSFPKEIIHTAIQEDVDVVGVSSLGGAHLTLGVDLIEEAKREGLKQRMAFIMGGVFPPADATKLKEIGFDETFMPGATREEIVSSIRRIVSDKADRSL
ncbi:MAG: cobalamin B12-binding domain-containing protein [Candidatus Bathyarchaeia archaeon]